MTLLTFLKMYKMLNIDTFEYIGFHINDENTLQNYNKNFNFISLSRKLHKMKYSHVLKQVGILFEYKRYIFDFKNMLQRYSFDIEDINTSALLFKLTNNL